MFTQAENILSRLIAFDTISQKTNRPCIDFIRDYLEGHGVASEIVASEDGSKACLWATVGNPEKPGIALAGHTDVVPVDGQKWTSDPFALAERDGKLYGRGVADMKGFIACALAFVPAFLAARTGRCFHLAFTYDEEISMEGAVRLTETLAARGVRPQGVWLGEPTGFSIIDQHKGAASFLTSFAGVSGHSSHPDRGLNAVESAALFMRAFMDVQQAKKDKPFSPSRFDPPYSTMNLGVIKGGIAENVIAEECELIWDIRSHPGESAAQIRDEIERKAAALLAPRAAAFPSLATMKTTTRCDIPPFQGRVGNGIVQTLKNVLKDAPVRAAGFGTEAGFFQKMGVDVAICGPGFIEQAHQPDEFIDKNQLLSCVDLMRQVLLCSSAPN